MAAIQIPRAANSKPPKSPADAPCSLPEQRVEWRWDGVHLQSYVFVVADGLLADPGLVVGHGPVETDSEDGEDEEFDVIFEDEADGKQPAADGKQNDTGAQGKLKGDVREEL